MRRLAVAALLSWLAPLAAAQTTQTTVEGPLVVQDVTCAGNLITSCEFIRDHLYLRAGDALDEEQIRNAQLRLSALRNFTSVNVHLEKGVARGAVVVVIEVEEASPIVREWLLGGSSRTDAQRGVFAGRIAHQNLFGKGKIVDLAAVAIVPVAGDALNEAYDVALRYVDPQLFDSSRYFGVAGVRWRKRRYEDIYGNFGSIDTGQFEVTVGRRIADFSYLSLGIAYRPDNDWVAGRWGSDGDFTISGPESFSHQSLTLAYGWNTEDDLYFPTQGSTFQINVGGDYQPNEPEGRSHLQFRKTWAASGAYWTFKVGGDPSPEYRSSLGESQAVSLSYARPVAPGDIIQRARWYIEPGFAVKGYTSSGTVFYEYGLKVGFRADTTAFGFVDLYLLATKDGGR
ncbi:MAG TPA: BamA/TamA family outer membrane protein [Steroidobacteraceae bacterium]|nr:BamA/TamA family outer membrane protein [Steroidobacteraceae bacterium]